MGVTFHQSSLGKSWQLLIVGLLSEIKSGHDTSFSPQNERSTATKAISHHGLAQEPSRPGPRLFICAAATFAAAALWIFLEHPGEELGWDDWFKHHLYNSNCSIYYDLDSRMIQDVFFWEWFANFENQHFLRSVWFNWATKSQPPRGGRGLLVFYLKR